MGAGMIWKVYFSTTRFESEEMRAFHGQDKALAFVILLRLQSTNHIELVHGNGDLMDHREIWINGVKMEKESWESWYLEDADVER